MSSILAWATGTAFPWILGILAVVVAAFGFRQSGKDEAYAQVATEELKRANAALSVTQGVAALSDTDVDRILRDQFGTS